VSPASGEDPNGRPTPEGAADADTPVDGELDDGEVDGPTGAAQDASGAAGTTGEADAEAAGPTRASGGGREVEVPDSLYRIVTVFSTLLAVVLVVLGFSVLDMATTVVSNPPASLVVGVLSLVVPMETLVAARSAVALGVGLVGLALVAGGAGVYVYGSRFRAPGMGKPKDEDDEASGDG